MGRKNSKCFDTESSLQPGWPRTFSLPLSASKIPGLEVRMSCLTRQPCSKRQTQILWGQVGMSSAHEKLSDVSGLETAGGAVLRSRWWMKKGEQAVDRKAEATTLNCSASLRQGSLNQGAGAERHLCPKAKTVTPSIPKLGPVTALHSSAVRERLHDAMVAG